MATGSTSSAYPAAAWRERRDLEADATAGARAELAALKAERTAGRAARARARELAEEQRKAGLVRRELGVAKSRQGGDGASRFAATLEAFRGIAVRDGALEGSDDAVAAWMASLEPEQREPVGAVLDELSAACAQHGVPLLEVDTDAVESAAQLDGPLHLDDLFACASNIDDIVAYLQEKEEGEPAPSTQDERDALRDEVRAELKGRLGGVLEVDVRVCCSRRWTRTSSPRARRTPPRCAAPASARSSSGIPTATVRGSCASRCMRRSSSSS